jgi:hypothetical protein
VVNVRVLGAVAALIVVALTVTGCYGSDKTYEEHFSHAEAVGVWQLAADVGDTTLTLNADDTYELAGWPKQYNCQNPPARTTEDIDWSDTMTVSDSWTLSGPKFGYSLVLYFPNSVGCASSPSAVVTVDSKGHPQLEFWLDSVKDPDSEIAPDQVLTFRKS